MCWSHLLLLYWVSLIVFILWIGSTCVWLHVCLELKCPCQCRKHISHLKRIRDSFILEPFWLTMIQEYRFRLPQIPWSNMEVVSWRVIVSKATESYESRQVGNISIGTSERWLQQGGGHSAMSLGCYVMTVLAFRFVEGAVCQVHDFAKVCICHTTGC